MGTLITAAAVWETVAPMVMENAKDALKSKWSKFKWTESNNKYKRHLTDHYSTTKLLGNPKPIRIKQIYTDVYVLDQLTAYRRLSIDEKGQLKEMTGLPISVKRIPLLDIVRDKSRVYILGKPGAGKSTFLKKLCLLCCEGSIPRTPIFISLKEWHDSSSKIEDFIVDEFDVCGFPDAANFVDALLESGMATVLFDGLDEIPHDNDSRQKAITALTRFAKKHKSVQIIMTCRIAAAEYSFDEFSYYEIADFSDEQQEDFIKKWYGTDSKSFGSFDKQWNSHENSGLRELAKTPLLLALLCLAFDETLLFPKRRVDLYNEASNALLRKWDATRGIRRDDIYKTLSPARKEQLLSKIAAATFTDSKIFFHKDYAAKVIESFLEQLPPREDCKSSDPLATLKSIEAQHGLLIERATDIYSFSHLSLHEYFTARFLVGASQSKELDIAVKRHYFQDSWREVFLMIASLLDDAKPLFTSIIELFSNRFFNSKEVRSLIILTAQASRVRASSEPNQEYNLILANDKTASSSIAKLKDLSFNLAAQFHFIQCRQLARNRVRDLNRNIEKIIVELLKSGQSSKNTLKPVFDYLQACIVVIESMQVASVSE